MAKNAKKAAVSTETASSADTVKIPEELTYECIVEAFKARAAKAKAPVDARVAAQVRLFGSVEGILYVLVANGIAVVEPFDYKGADLEIVADADVFMEVIKGRKHMSYAISDGDIKMQGNAGKAIVLADAVF